MLGGTTVPAGVNLAPAPGSGVPAYEAMVAAGFVKEATYVGETTTYPRSFSLFALILNNVSPPGATVVLALAAWNTGAASWSAMLATATPATRAGVVAFVQPTVAFITTPPVPPPLAMDQDLVMTAIPEPCVPALAGLGGAVLLLARRFARRRRACSAGFQACRGNFLNPNWFQDDNTWADADGQFFYYAWSDHSRTWTNGIGGTNYTTRPDADVMLARILQ